MIRAGHPERDKPETWPLRTQASLARVGVRVQDDGSLRCQHCGATWHPRVIKGGAMLAWRWWCCPSGLHEVPPKAVVDLPYQH